MESALMTTPPKRWARPRAAADLPLAVGPAMRMALGRPASGVTSRARRHGDEAKLALGVGQQKQHRFPARFLHREHPRFHVLRLLHLLLRHLDDDLAGL